MGREVAVIDDIDRGIIALLTRDGRRPYTAIAAELEVSEGTVRSRVGKLQESGILRIVALCSPLTLGHQSVRFQVSVRDHTARSVALSLAGMRMINHVALITGARDIYIETACRDLGQLVTLLDDIRRVPGVAFIDQYILTELYKDYSWMGLRGGLGQSSTSTA
jgi:Lrp/AsnC family transcriptional regulator, regulator for asnA, asnC and gidA